ncbi:MAG: GDSL-type esterase/lipase family protein [Saprospiraceae bacterium]|nr:GDSL-type esterase/lipase family protein [Saprospiraceae bacterium]
MNMKKESIFKLISIGFGITITLLFIEIGLRYISYNNYHSLDEIGVEKRKPLNDPQSEKTLGEIIQLSTSNKIIYELIPNSIYSFQNVIVKTNSNGFRDKEYPTKKTNKTKRIIGLGDSIMFGWGVDEEECYLSRLENMLNQNRNDSTNYEVINTGVPGYNTAMEVAVLKNKIDLSQVDLVIINFIENDFDLPNFIRKKPPYDNFKQSFIRKELFPRSLDGWRGIDSRLHEAPFDTSGYYEKDPENVPNIYKEMVGETGYLTAMQTLNNLSEKHGFKLILLTNSLFKPRPKPVKDFAKKSKIYYLDVKDDWKICKPEFNNKPYHISDIDYHPNRYGHACNARILYRKIKEIL